jgi:hypothetical protein
MDPFRISHYPVSHLPKTFHPMADVARGNMANEIAQIYRGELLKTKFF